MANKLSLAITALAAAPLSAQQPAAPSPIPSAPVSGTPATATPVSLSPARPAVAEPDVAGIVAREFPAYDKDASGSLNQSEFGDWMVKLKTIADPASTANDAAVKTWVNAAFAQADVDRSRALTLGELMGFLNVERG